MFYAKNLKIIVFQETLLKNFLFSSHYGIFINILLLDGYVVSYRMQCRMGTVNFLRKTTVTFTYLKPFTKWWKVCVQCFVFLFFFILHLEKLLVFYSPSLRNFQKYWVEFVATCSVTVKKWQVNLGRNWWMKSNKPLTHLIIFSFLTLD